MSENSPEPFHHAVTWPEIHRDARLLVRKLMDSGPWKGIVALTRGGLVPAAIVAREMSIHVVDTLCISTYDEQLMGTVNVLKLPEAAMENGGEGWLLIDDLVDTGTTAKKAREVLPNAFFATVYAKPDGQETTDLYVHEIDQDIWVHFPWDTEQQYVAPMSKRAKTEKS
ncbi:MAG: xanthine phosphoribosyltransferase [Rhodospirillales bacterium]|jgi:xanthine phosphoribosyltransferase|nr:xanthine phosphoribosyltransferase [Rhodospirillales bacterium]